MDFLCQNRHFLAATVSESTRSNLLSKGVTLLAFKVYSGAGSVGAMTTTVKNRKHDLAEVPQRCLFSRLGVFLCQLNIGVRCLLDGWVNASWGNNLRMVELVSCFALDGVLLEGKGR